MDEFDTMIKKSKRTYTPSAHFTENTMKKVSVVHAHKRKSWRIWVPSIVGAGAIATLAFIAIPNWVAGTTTPPLTSSQTSSSTPTNATAPAGTDDQSLANDMNDIQSSQSQESTDQGHASSALNDSSQQIAVPTD